MQTLKSSPGCMIVILYSKNSTQLEFMKEWSVYTLGVAVLLFWDLGLSPHRSSVNLLCYRVVFREVGT